MEKLALSDEILLKIDKPARYIGNFGVYAVWTERR